MIPYNIVVYNSVIWESNMIPYNIVVYNRGSHIHCSIPPSSLKEFLHGRKSLARQTWKTKLIEEFFIGQADIQIFSNLTEESERYCDYT